jgi:hypothetical protein
VASNINHLLHTMIRSPLLPLLLLSYLAIVNADSFALPEIDSYYDYTAELEGSEKCALMNIVMDESSDHIDETIKQDDQAWMRDVAIPEITRRLKAEGMDKIFICTHGFGNSNHDNTIQETDPTVSDEHHVGHFHGCSLADANGIIDAAPLDSLATEGYTEDGYQAIHFAVRDIPAIINNVDIASTCGALAKNMILLTDEWRDASDSSYTKENTIDLLTEKSYRLNLVSMLEFGNHRWENFHLISDLNFDLIDHSLGSTYESVIFKEDGVGHYSAITEYSDEGVDPIDTVFVMGMNGANPIRDDYAAIAFATQGAAWALGRRHQGGTSEASLTQAFADYKALEMLVDVGLFVTPPSAVSQEKPDQTCSENVELLQTTGGTSAPYEPMEVLEQGTDYVKFIVRNPFTKIESMHVQLDEIKEKVWEFQTGDSECYNENDVDHEESVEYTAYCMPNNPISVVNIWMSDSTSLNPSMDNAQVPECCFPDPDDDNPKVQYTYMLHCVSQCNASSTSETNGGDDETDLGMRKLLSGLGSSTTSKRSFLRARS